jgi:hypothetical protein
MIPEKKNTKTILIFDVLTAKRLIRKSMVYTWTLVPSLQKKKNKKMATYRPIVFSKMLPETNIFF